MLIIKLRYTGRKLFYDSRNVIPITFSNLRNLLEGILSVNKINEVLYISIITVTEIYQSKFAKIVVDFCLDAASFETAFFSDYLNFLSIFVFQITLSINHKMEYTVCTHAELKWKGQCLK